MDKLFLNGLKLIILLLIASTSGMSADESNNTSCNTGEWKCSENAYTLMQCSDGTWKNTECMKTEGKLCENNACVFPWKYGSPAWPAPAPGKLDTKETLSQKAKYYEELSVRLLVNPKLKLMTRAFLPCKPIECAPGTIAPCLDCTEPSISVEKATWKDVEKWDHLDNDGLFSGLYLAAEAFRYGATRDPQSLKMIKLLLEGEVIRTRITGVPGLYTRSYIPPDVKGISCPTDPTRYIHNLVEGNNTWVLIDNNGCAKFFDEKNGDWKTTTHCVDKEFAGWCWMDNVSKDEYSGHMFALGAIAKLVDDPEVQAIVKQLISEIAKHLIKNRMEFVDWDGRVPSYGKIHTATFFDYSGLNATMALDFMTIAANVTKDADIKKWLDECLLQKKGSRRCLNSLLETPEPYTTYMPRNGIYTDPDGCLMNFDNNSMHLLSMHNLIWFEHDPALREKYQKSLDEDVFRPEGQKRALIFSNNAFYDFIFASQKKLGPGSDGPSYEVVKNGIEMLRQIPLPYRRENKIAPPEKNTTDCKGRSGENLAELALTPGERCPDFFNSWYNPYVIENCTKNHRMILQPTDFLLPYWMGRYYGFISADM